MAVPQEDSPCPPKPESGTSLTLLARLRANEPDAWRTLLQLYSPLVYQWCARAGVSGSDAEDVSQEVFQAVASHLQNFRRDREGDTFRGWLRIITRNTILLHFRRRGRQPQARGGTDAWLQLQQVEDLTPGPPEHGADELEANGVRRRALELIRSQFEERTWQMFWRTFIEERSPVEVAAELNATPAAVRKAKSRVLHRLKEQFAELLS